MALNNLQLPDSNPNAEWANNSPQFSMLFAKCSKTCVLNLHSRINKKNFNHTFVVAILDLIPSSDSLYIFYSERSNVPTLKPHSAHNS